MTESLLAVLLLAVVAFLIYRATRPPAPRKRTASDLRVELRRLTRDPLVAERLLDRHRRKNPEATEKEILRLAIAELRADRR